MKIQNYVDSYRKAKEIQKSDRDGGKKKYLKEEVFRSIPKDITELYPLARMMKDILSCILAPQIQARLIMH